MKIKPLKLNRKKVTNTVGTFLKGSSYLELFKKRLAITYQQIVSESVRVSDTQVASEKVANTVATFLKGGSNGSLFKRAIGYIYQYVVTESIQLLATQAASKKVANTVATFLTDDSDRFHFKHFNRLFFIYQTNPPNHHKTTKKSHFLNKTPKVYSK